MLSTCFTFTFLVNGVILYKDFNFLQPYALSVIEHLIRCHEILWSVGKKYLSKIFYTVIIIIHIIYDSHNINLHKTTSQSTVKIIKTHIVAT